MPSVAGRACVRHGGHKSPFKPIAYRSPDPRARSPLSRPAAPSRTRSAAHPGHAARGPDALPDFTLRFAVPRRSPIASVPRDRPSGSHFPVIGRASLGRTETRLGSAPRRTRPAVRVPEVVHGCVFLCTRESLPVRGLIVPDPRTSHCAVMYSTGVAYIRVRVSARTLLETARCRAESGLLKVTRSHRTPHRQTSRRSGRIRVQCRGKHLL